MPTGDGLGYSHRQARQELPPPAGEPCPYCNAPMWPTMKLDADHADPRALGGRGALRWTHSTCNRRAGAVLGNRLRGLAVREPDRWTDRWA